jgi:hypothetical protein
MSTQPRVSVTLPAHAPDPAKRAERRHVAILASRAEAGMARLIEEPTRA